MQPHPLPERSPSQRSCLLDSALVLAGLPILHCSLSTRTLHLGDADLHLRTDEASEFPDIEAVVTTANGRSTWWFVPSANSEQLALEMLALVEELRGCGHKAHLVTPSIAALRTNRLFDQSSDCLGEAIIYRSWVTKQRVELFEEPLHSRPEPAICAHRTAPSTQHIVREPM